MNTNRSVRVKEIQRNLKNLRISSLSKGRNMENLSLSNRLPQSIYVSQWHDRKSLNMRTLRVAGPNVRANGVTLRRSESPKAKNITLKFKSPEHMKKSNIYFSNREQKGQYERQKQYDSTMITFNPAKKVNNPELRRFGTPHKTKQSMIDSKMSSQNTFDSIRRVETEGSIKSSMTYERRNVRT